MRILIATDAWLPQTNGVVTTLRNTLREIERLGHEAVLVTPAQFRSVRCPSYPEIRLALAPRWHMRALIERAAPDAVHIDTEGPVGLAARRACLDTGRRFTTAWHTQFPEFVHARCRLPLAWSYAALRRFHAPSSAVMVATSAVERTLAARGFGRLARWTRGVDVERFTPGPRAPRAGRVPIFLYAGRVAVEKRIEDFLALDLPGERWVVGDGPARARLQARFPDARFFGMQHGDALVDFYRRADVFVFPSQTDTFGLVMLEALACGTPVAALPVTGPVDVIRDARVGVLDHDLRAAALAALALDRDDCRRYACARSWVEATQQFVANLVHAWPGDRSRPHFGPELDAEAWAAAQWLMLSRAAHAGPAYSQR
ncbi:MAG: glycosyltransferase family 1 protein [Proteobacteria bacterium]|nr:glycosyltransferase family 1 protein [Pseudomonadota bacterium]